MPLEMAHSLHGKEDFSIMQGVMKQRRLNDDVLKKTLNHINEWMNEYSLSKGLQCIVVFAV